MRYRDEVVHNIVRPYAGATGPDFILMDDNARPHRARVVEQYLQDETIDRMDWPARSPDINPTLTVFEPALMIMSHVPGYSVVVDPP